MVACRELGVDSSMRWPFYSNTLGDSTPEDLVELIDLQCIFALRSKYGSSVLKRMMQLDYFNIYWYI